MNQLIIAGNIGRDAEIRTTPTGAQAIAFTVAVSEKYTNASGETVENTVWVSCTKWVQPGKSTAVAQYLKRGTKVLVTGKANVRAWLNDATGEAKASLELRVDQLELMGSANQQPAPGGYASPEANAQQPQAQQPRAQAQPATYTPPFNPDPATDDLPF